VVLLDVVVFAVVGGSWFCLFAVVWFWLFASGFVGVVLVVCGGGFLIWRFGGSLLPW
jgi:hypothetical protein